MLYCLGDRAYGLKTWLMTPYANPETPQEVRYNNIHAHTRAVERTFGVLKGRWMCLDQIRLVANYFIPLRRCARSSWHAVSSTILQ